MTRSKKFFNKPRFIPCQFELKGVAHDRAACQFSHNFQICDVCHVALTTTGSIAQHYQGQKHKQQLARKDAMETLITAMHQQSLEDKVQAPQPVRCHICHMMFPSHEYYDQHVKRSPEHKRRLRVAASRQNKVGLEADKNGIVVTPSSANLNFGILNPSSKGMQRAINISNNSPRTIKLTQIEERQPNLRQTIHLAHSLSYYLTPIPPGRALEVWVAVNPVASHIGVLEREFRFVFDNDPNFFISRSVKCTVGDKALWESLLPPPESEYKPYVPNKKRLLNKNENVIQGVRPPQTRRNIEYARPLQQYFPSDALKDLIIAHTAQEKDKAEPGQQRKDTSGYISMGEMAKNLRKTWLRPAADMKAFATYWHNLICLEEIQMHIDIDQYTLENVPLAFPSQLGRQLRLYTIAVPGLAEKRPSVLHGDAVRLKLSDGGQHTWVGYAVRILQQEVQIQVNADFDRQIIKGQLFDIRFSLYVLMKRTVCRLPAYSLGFGSNRIPLRRMHNAVDAFSISNPLSLFSYALLRHESPKTQLDIAYDATMSAFLNTLDDIGERIDSEPADEAAKQKAAVERGAFDRKLLQNPEQLDAVIKIRHGRHHPMPFTLFGPPGTGKTVTLVEAIKQLGQQKENRLLVCAPSNDAADLFILRLSDHFAPRSMFRLNAITRQGYEELPGKIKDYSMYNSENSVFDIPTCAELHAYKIVVATCTTGGLPYELGVPQNFFTHVLIDEAGQALDCEMQIAANRYIGPHTRVILAGDPRQLGPIVRSSLAKMFGFNKTFLEQYMNTLLYTEAMAARGQSEALVDSPAARLAATVYCEIKDAGKIVRQLYTKLLQNYRSHEAILRLPNQLFYNNQLKVCADPAIQNRFVSWTELPSQGYPLIFQHVQGEDMREGNSPSWFNPAEVTVVKSIVDKLKAAGKSGFRPPTDNDIGIITPYHRQVQKIRNALRPTSPNIKVGSVETFQGQERPIIIISTVRSQKEHLLHDKRCNLGFVADAKRFNVAITRAMSLLVVIGNANLLWGDDNWRKLLQMLLKNSAVIGWDGPTTVDEDGNEVQGAHASEQSDDDADEEDFENIVYRAGAEDIEWVQRE
ncbi:hypothetical protein RI367_006941 [Sorochytrium milnesiophthora]